MSSLAQILNSDGNVTEKVLSNAPDRVKDFYAVPKVLD